MTTFRGPDDGEIEVDEIIFDAPDTRARRTLLALADLIEADIGRRDGPVDAA